MKFDSVDTGFLMTRPPLSSLILFSVFLTFFLLSGCSSLPGIKSNPFSSGDKKESGKAPLSRVPSEALDGFSLALKAMQEGQDDVALDLFKELQINYPELSGSWLNTGVILMKRKEFQKALPMFEKATSINPDNKVAYNQMGVCLRQLGRFEDAKSAYLEALRIDPNYALAHYNLGVLFELYFQDFYSAYTHFLNYQNLQKEEDPIVANWLKDLQRRANIPEPEPEPEQEAIEPEPVQADKSEQAPKEDKQQKNERKTLW